MVSSAALARTGDLAKPSVDGSYSLASANLK